MDPSSLDPTKLRVSTPQSVKDLVNEFCQNSGSILPVAQVSFRKTNGKVFVVVIRVVAGGSRVCLSSSKRTFGCGVVRLF